MASASYLVNGSSPAGGVSVSASSTVNLALVSTTGVNSVAWSIVGNHSDEATNPTITPAGTPSGATASFTMPSGAGQAYIVRCRINGGRDAMGRTVEAYTFQALVGVDTVGGLLPFAAGETTERSATHGHTMALNAMANAAGGGGTVLGSGTTGQLAYWVDENTVGATTNPGTTLGTILANGNNADGDQIKNLLDPTDPQDAVTKSYLDDAIGALTAEDIAWDDSGGSWPGQTEIQTILDSTYVSIVDLSGGKIVATSTPAYVASYGFFRPRTEDGAFITRLSSNVYKANLTKSTTHNAATAVELATVYMAANTTAVIGVVIQAVETGSPTVRANLRFHVDVQCEADNDMVKIDALSTWNQPDALPLSSVPDWIGASYAAFNSLVTIDLATDNYVKIKVTPANTDTVRWTIDVDATITEL